MKTKAMILTTQFKIIQINISNFKMKMDNDNIMFVTEIKYLVFIILIIDNSLTF